MEKQSNFKIIVMNGNYTNRTEKFQTYESAVTFFQEMCEDVFGWFPEINHTSVAELHESEANISVILEFIN